MKGFGFKSALCLVALPAQLTVAFKQCPYLGADFPAPTTLGNSTVFQKAIANLTTALNSGIQAGQFNSNTTSFAINIFSTTSNTSLYQYHHTAPPALLTNGTKSVNADSIFRIGSVSKLFSVYLFLIEAGDVHFHEPITKFVPELAAVAKTQNTTIATENAADVFDWEDITIGNIASQLGGLPRDYTGDLLADLARSQTALDGTGFPVLNTSDFVICAQPGSCNRTQFFQTLTQQRHPVFPTSYTPNYSNTGFQLLGYALENITNTPFETMFNRSIIEPLGMTGTSYNLPLNSSIGVIPSTSPATTWGLSGSDYNPAGGFYSTTNDLAKLGRAILTSQLISAPMTRRWMKPLTHTADLRVSVGAPWEIERLSLPAPQEKVVDLYGKSGDIGTYHASYALIPDWQIGYTINIADVPNVPSMANNAIGEMINELVLPSIEETARREADVNYAGQYRARDLTLNSTLTLTTSNETLGLGVKEWISNSTDMFATFGKLRKLPAANISITLYPTGLTNTLGGSKKQAWRAAIENNWAPPQKGILGCISWFLVDGPIHGGISGDEFAFEVDDQGMARGVEVRALRVGMERVV